MAFIAALRCDRIDASCALDQPDPLSGTLCVANMECNAKLAEAWANVKGDRCPVI